MSIGRWILSAALAVHIASVVIGVWPVSARARRLVRPYLQFTGLWQRWQMFAPNPVRTNTYFEAELRMADGSTKVWAFPRMEGLDLWAKFREERSRKWAAELVRRNARPAIWQVTARYVARLHAGDPAGPPQAVALRRHVTPIPDPHLLWLPRGFENAVPSSEEVLFRYTVQPEDLRPSQAAR